MRLKDDWREIEQITEEKAIDEYRLLKSKLEYTYNQYIEQKRGLQIRKQKLKKERDDCIKMIIIMVVISAAISYIPALFLVKPIVDGVILFLMPLYVIGAIEKVFQYAVMMEKGTGMGALSKSHIITYMAEERFLDNAIREYKEELDKNYTDDELNVDILFKLNKMTAPKPYYATAINRDFKCAPLFIIIIFCVVYLFFIWMQLAGY